MTLVQRHYVLEFLKLFALIGAGLAMMFSLFELVQLLDTFMPHDPSAWDLLRYVALKIPQYALALMPVAALLCSLYTISHAARGKELVAVRAAGGRLKRLLVPFILIGIAISLAGFALGEFAVPKATRKAQELKLKMRNQTAAPTLLRDGVLWYRADNGSIVKIDYYQPESGSYAGLSIYQRRSGSLTEIIHAREAVFSSTAGWTLLDVERYSAESGEMAVYESYEYPHLGPPSILLETAQRPTEMGITELYRYSERLRNAGFRNVRIAVDLHSKISYPLISLLMVVIGVSIPVRGRFGGFMATAIGLLITLVYWFGYSMSLSMGYAGVLPPLLAAWLMPLVSGSAGAWLYSIIPE